MRPRPDEYLVTMTVGARSRKLIWHDDHSLELDLPHGWKMERDGDTIWFRDGGDPSFKAQLQLQEFSENKSPVVKLPSSKVSARHRPISLQLIRLRAPRPLYVPPTSAYALQTTAPRQLCMFYGQRYFLIRYRPVSHAHEAVIGSLHIFSYRKSAMGYTITCHQSGVKINVGGHKTLLRWGESLEIPTVDFLRCTIICGIHWWRLRMVPTPDQQPPLETDESEEDLHEALRLKQSTYAMVALIGVLLLATFILGRLTHKPKIIAQTKVELKAPKIIPALEEPKLPEPKVVEVPKPTPPAVEPTPPPKVVKASPKPKAPPRAEPKVATKKAPQVPIKEQKTAKVKSAPEAPAKRQPVREPAPKLAEAATAGQLKAAQQAREQQAQQAQLTKALGFLSTSNTKPAAPSTNYESTTGKFANAPRVGGVTSKSNVLSKIESGAPGDGAIDTKSTRNLAVDNLNFGKGKGLNDVQGRVSAGELYSKDGNPGSFMGNGKGLQLSGSGDLSEGEIEAALARYLARFQYCYEKALLGNPNLGGNLVVQWTITLAGRASSSRMIKSQLNDETLHNCVIGVLAEVPFPKPKGGTVTVKKTFSFSSTAL